MNEMLVEMESGVSELRGEVLDRYVSDPIGRRVVGRLIRSQTVRSLLELELNGCTNHEAARVLMADELIVRRCFKARAQGFRGKDCEGIELTILGNSVLFESQEGLEGSPWLALVKDAILGYACVDYGRGICGTRSRIETALEMSDADLLQRLVFLGAGNHQFSNSIRSTEKVSPTMRSASASWWSDTGDVRRSGQIIDLSSS